jgi:hypothetical protein
MALKGKAKTDYQREYMRRRRAGAQPQAKPSGHAQDKAAAKIAALEQELAQAKRRITELQTQPKAAPGNLEDKG